jgi:hypothetical protein
VGKLAEKLGPSEAQAAARDLETLVSEATVDKPRPSILRVTGEGLIEAAKTVAEMAGPISVAVQAIFGLFGIS